MSEMKASRLAKREAEAMDIESGNVVIAFPFFVFAFMLYYGRICIKVSITIL